MTDEVTINNKVYHAIRIAAGAVLYSPDYITRLAREKKVTAVQLGRRWYVQIESLKAYAEVQDQEQTIKKKLLRQQRKTERVLRDKVSPATRPQQLLEYQVIATIAGMLVVGVLLGSELSSATSARSNSAVVVETQETFTAQELVGKKMLHPEFHSNQTRVFVEDGRTIIHPAEPTVGWQYIHHE